MRIIAQSPAHFDPGAEWRGGGARTVAETPIFGLLEMRRASPHGGAEGAFYRLACPEWVHVIPFTAGGAGLELLAVEQYRHGTDGASLEVPGGVCGPGESPLDAAKRELLEETGHASESWTRLGSCAPNPAIQDNRCHFFLALGCAPARGLALDPTEELRVWAMPLWEWEQKMESGEVHHGLILAAFLRLRLSPAWDGLREMAGGGPKARCLHGQA
jgi:8-oxo-dGTP pyrophosphatase MutT (NUDIX family)